MILESGTVIIHVIPKEKKSPILTLPNERVPRLLIGFLVAFDAHDVVPWKKERSLFRRLDTVRSPMHNTLRRLRVITQKSAESRIVLVLTIQAFRKANLLFDERKPK